VTAMKVELDLNTLLGFEYDEDGEPIGRRELRGELVALMARTLMSDMRNEAMADVRAAVHEQVRDEVKKVVQEAMAKPIQQTTTWGEPKGEPTTVLELIRLQIEAFLSNSGRGRDSYNREPGNLKDLIADATNAVLSKELRSEIDVVKRQINTQIQEHALKAAAESLTRGLKV
jgi:hypothetical protein